LPPRSTAATIKATAVASDPGFTRLIVEKPFGSDHASATELAKALGAIFDEVRCTSRVARDGWAGG